MERCQTRATANRRSSAARRSAFCSCPARTARRTFGRGNEWRQSIFTRVRCSKFCGHGCIVYLALITSMSYFREIVRVTNPGAHVIFDIIDEDCLDDEAVDKWLSS